MTASYWVNFVEKIPVKSKGRRLNSTKSNFLPKFEWIHILPNNQLDALFYVFIYFISLHVSSIKCSSSGDRIVRINTSSGMINLRKWLLVMPKALFLFYLFIYFISSHVSSIKCSSSGDRIVVIRHLVWLVCVSDCLVWWRQ